jgi:RimJ/RimL family protein N-acetyltransferase
MGSIPKFETGRLILREITLRDAGSYQRHFNDYAVISQLAAAVPWPYPDSGAEDFIRTVIIPQQGQGIPQQGQGRWFWGIFLKENPDEMIGGVDLWRKGSPENRGFWLGKKFWGHGIMTEAVKPIMDYAFDHLGFEMLVFSNALGNSKSRRIKEKTGARLVGTRPAKFVSSEYTEAETWELTKREWAMFRSGDENKVMFSSSDPFGMDTSLGLRTPTPEEFLKVAELSFNNFVEETAKSTGQAPSALRDKLGGPPTKRRDDDVWFLIEDDGSQIGFVWVTKTWVPIINTKCMAKATWSREKQRFSPVALDWAPLFFIFPRMAPINSHWRDCRKMRQCFVFADHVGCAEPSADGCGLPIC